MMSIRRSVGSPYRMTSNFIDFFMKNSSQTSAIAVEIASISVFLMIAGLIMRTRLEKITKICLIFILFNKNYLELIF